MEKNTCDLEVTSYTVEKQGLEDGVIG